MVSFSSCRFVHELHDLRASKNGIYVNAYSVQDDYTPHVKNNPELIQPLYKQPGKAPETCYWFNRTIVFGSISTPMKPKGVG